MYIYYLDKRINETSFGIERNSSFITLTYFNLIIQPSMYVFIVVTLSTIPKLYRF